MSDRTALVTGGARRIGAAIVAGLHRDGYRVIVHCNRSCAAAEKLTAALSKRRAGSCIWISADLSDCAATRELAEQALQTYGRVDLLINNASAFIQGPIQARAAAAIDSAQLRSVLGTNLIAPLLLAQHLATELSARRGAVINISDRPPRRTLRLYPAYCAAKGGLDALTRSLAQSLAPEVRVNGIAPGAIQWPEDAPVDEALRSALLADVPLGRQGALEDIVAAVRFLAAGAAYVTGQTLPVDGGRRLTG